MRRPTAILVGATCAALVPLLLPATAGGHAEAQEQYRTRVLEVAPEGVPVEVSVDGDEIRFENHGEKDLVICGYESEQCEAWVRIGPDGVFEDRNSRAFYANAEDDAFGKIPDAAGEGEPKFVRVRREPAFYAYHDHRVHWMGGDTLPPGVDVDDPDPQHVFDGRVEFRYGDSDGFVRTRLEYVGGQTWLQRYGEYTLMVAAIIVMLGVFTLDARRRRRSRSEAS